MFSVHSPIGCPQPLIDLANQVLAAPNRFARDLRLQLLQMECTDKHYSLTDGGHEIIIEPALLP